MTDVTALIGGRATGRIYQQTVSAYVSTEKTAPSFPSTLTMPDGSVVVNPVYVVIPGVSTEVSIPLAGPRSAGSTAPAQGDRLLVGYDENRTPHITVWF